MNLALSDEQVMLREAAASALSRHDTVAAARAAADGEPLPDLWPTAVEAGWPGLLIAEEHGGAGLGPFDAMLVMEECGRRLAGAGLLGHFMATSLVPVDGDQRAAYAPARPPTGDEAWTVTSPEHDVRAPLPVYEDGQVTGTIGFVPDAPGADVLLVAALADGWPVVVQVEGAQVEPVTRCDASRPLGHVRLDATPGTIVATGPEPLARAWYIGQALLAADALGLCQTMLEMGVAYAKDRHAFGRPIGSYQAVKHQLVEILRRIDRIRNLCYFTGLAVDAQPEDLPLAASSARFAAEEGSDYATRTCIAVHGGIGATWEHDAPFFWRRSQLSRLLLGGGADAGDRVAGEIIAKARARTPVAA